MCDSIFWYPVTKAAIADPLTRYWVPNTDAVFWWSLESPISGRILHTHVWLHSHRARFGGLLFVSGQHSPDSLASIGPSCIVGSKSAGRRTADEGASAACTDLMEVRRRLYAAAESRGILICADDEVHSPSYIHIPRSPDGSIAGGYYDRQGRLVCKPFTLVQNGILSVFAFSTARWHSEIDPFPQHTMTFAYVDTNASYTQLVETWPRKYGQWELSSNKTRGGGRGVVGSYREGLHVDKSSPMTSGSFRVTPSIPMIYQLKDYMSRASLRQFVG